MHGRDRHYVSCSMVCRGYMVINQHCVRCWIGWARLMGQRPNELHGMKIVKDNNMS